MKIVVLGATGRTGQHVLEQALEAGHAVTAVARNPASVTLRHAGLRVLQASVFATDQLTEAFRGHDAVVSALGFSKLLGFGFRECGYSDSMRAIVAAMRAAGVRRLVVMTAYYTDTETARGLLYNWFIVPMIKYVLWDMRAMEQWLAAEAGDVDWTVVRPGMLTDAARKDQPALTERDGQFVADPRASIMIPRANVAAFMLSQIPQTEFMRAVVAIAVQ